MEYHIEFTCIDCHAHVYAWGGSKMIRCATCQWIYDQPNLTKKEIMEIRIITHTPILEKEDE